MADLSDVIGQFLADRRARGLSRRTIVNEKQVLQLLLADVGNINTRRLRPQHMDLFWANRTTWSAGTMNRARHSLMGFFDWCHDRGHLSRDCNPMAGTRKIRVAPRDRIIIPQSEFENLLESVREPRGRICVALGLYLFLRISEIQHLRWQDVDMEGGTIQVFRPKTKTLDTLPLCDELLHELRRWKLAYAAKVGETPTPSWYLVPGLPPHGGLTGRKGTQGLIEVVPRPYQPMLESNLNYTMKTVLKDSGYYRPQEGGHTLRRSGAIALYNQLTSVGHDRAIRICQAMLGHASVQTTEGYLRLDLDRKVRNDLLAGKRMFPEGGTGTVIHLEGILDGQEDARVV